MKRIGIIGAMEVEVEMLKDATDIERVENITGMKFVVGQLEGKDIVLVTSGIGKVNAAVCAQVLVNKFDVTHIINTGVAGAIHEELDFGDLVISTDLIEHDMDATGFGYEPGQIPQMETWVFKADDELIDLAEKAGLEEEITHSIFKGRIVSGDVFISSVEKKNYLSEQFKAHAAEMEGAAIAHTCYLNEVPFLILRAMSDKANGKAHENFDVFCQEAAVNSSNIVKNILRNLKK